jgi:hypothetical protein
MILVVVAVGTTVFAFASGGFDSFGSSFSNLMGNSGNQISEQVVVEQAVFVNTGRAATSGADLYVRDVGLNPSTIAAVYVQNATTGSFVEQFTAPPLPTTINSGVFQIVFVSNFVPDHGIVYTFTLATTLGNTVSTNAKYY